MTDERLDYLVGAAGIAAEDGKRALSVHTLDLVAIFVELREDGVATRRAIADAYIAGVNARIAAREDEEWPH